MPWFGNTLFVLTAAHTADLLRQGEVSGSAYDHWIPLCYYMPGRLKPEQDDRITQQIDILPTVLDLIGYPKPFFSFGSSSLRIERLPAAVSESNATWLLVGDSCQVRSDGEQVLWSAGLLRPWTTTCTDSFALLPTLQAAIQQYHNNILRHTLVFRRP